MNKFTVVYTFSVGFAGTLVSHTHVTLKTNQTLNQALIEIGIDPGALVLVFPGYQECIESDWSVIYGE